MFIHVLPEIQDSFLNYSSPPDPIGLPMDPPWPVLLKPSPEDRPCGGGRCLDLLRLPGAHQPTPKAVTSRRRLPYHVTFVAMPLVTIVASCSRSSMPPMPFGARRGSSSASDGRWDRTRSGESPVGAVAGRPSTVEVRDRMGSVSVDGWGWMGPISGRTWRTNDGECHWCIHL